MAKKFNNDNSSEFVNYKVFVIVIIKNFYSQDVFVKTLLLFANPQASLLSIKVMIYILSYNTVVLCIGIIKVRGAEIITPKPA